MKMIKFNLKGSYSIVPEGERKLTISEYKAIPSGNPESIEMTMKDSECGSLRYKVNLKNSTSVWAFGLLCEKALGVKDGDEFDVINGGKLLVGKTLLCEVKHTLGTTPNDDGEYPKFANIKKVISKVDNDVKEEDLPTEMSPREALVEDDL